MENGYDLIDVWQRLNEVESLIIAGMEATALYEIRMARAILSDLI
jgi:hypothetical protein